MSNYVKSPTFNVGIINADVFCVYKQGSKVIIGGDFTSIGGVSRTGIARLNADGTVDTTFSTGGTGFGGAVIIHTIIPNLAYAGEFLCAGVFQSYNGTTCPYLISLTEDGEVSPNWKPAQTLGDGFDNAVFDLVYVGGYLYCVGQFNNYTYAGTPYAMDSIAKILYDGTWNANSNTFKTNIGTGADGGNCYGIGYDNGNGSFVFGGSFSTLNGNAAGNIGRCNSLGQLSIGFAGLGANSLVLVCHYDTESEYPNAMYIGGVFDTYNGGTLFRAARINTLTGMPEAAWTTGWASGVNSTVYHIKGHPTQGIVMGGQFSTHKGWRVNHILSVDNNGNRRTDPQWGVPTFDAGTDVGFTDGTVRDTAEINSSSMWVGNTSSLYRSAAIEEIALLQEYAAPVDPTPTGLNATSVTWRSATLNWTSNATSGTNAIEINGVIRWYVNYAIETFDLTSYMMLDPNMTYTFRVSAYVGGSHHWSAPATFKTSLIPPPLCSLTPTEIMTTYDATCGNEDGYFKFKNTDYLLLYDTVWMRTPWATLRQFDVNPASPTYGESQESYANWYGLQATPKPEYVPYYGNDDCYVVWFPLYNSDTTITLDGSTVKPSICDGLGEDEGRFNYSLSDTDGGATTYEIYWMAVTGDPETEGTIVESRTGVTDISNVVFYPNRYRWDTYIGLVYSVNNGCTTLLPQTTTIKVNQINMAGINRLWITNWDNNLYYNYWSTEDDFYNDPNIDPQYYTSLKIKEFQDLPEPWVEVPLDGVEISLNQKMEIGNVGYTFVDELTMTINNYDNTKWNDLTDLYDTKHILLAETYNGTYQVIGYRHGAEISTFSDNSTMSFTWNAISEAKIIPELAYEYVRDYVLTGSTTILDNCEYSVNGVKNVWLAGYLTDGELIDFPLEYTVASGSTESIIEVEWDETGIEPTATIGGQEMLLRRVKHFGEDTFEFKETYEKNNAGFEYVKTLTIKIPNVQIYSTTAIKEYLFSITKDFKTTENCIFMQDFNDNFWIIGYDNPVKLLGMTINLTESNDYTLDFESRSPRRMRNFVKT